MRAKSVNEFQNFERGIDPKEAMGIGTYPKDPTPKLTREVKKLLKNPKEIEFSNFNKSVHEFRNNFLLLSLKSALISEFGLPVKVLKRLYNEEVIMDLPNGFSIVFNSSESKGSWFAFLQNDKGRGIDRITSSTVFRTIPPKVRELLKKHNIKI